MLKVDFQKRMVTNEGIKNLIVKFECAQGEFVSLFGESGAGKTTVLKIISGLLKPDWGNVSLADEVWFDADKKIDRKIQNRHVGYVFQEPRLFPHMSVLENLEFVLRNKKDRSQISEFIELVQLKGLEFRRPAQLSGGQKQRVALARAFLCRPKLLLLDEPFTALDAVLRLKLQEDVLKLQQRTKITTILVTHDLSEVFRLTRKTFVIEDGRISRRGSPQELFAENNVSGKFKFTGQLIDIIKDGVVNIVTVQIGNDLIKVIATDEEIRGMGPGERVVVASKAFNPLILKVTDNQK